MITLTAGTARVRAIGSGNLVVLLHHVEQHGDLLGTMLGRQRPGVVAVVVQRSEQTLHLEMFCHADPVVVVFDQNSGGAVVTDLAIDRARIKKASPNTILNPK